MGNRCTQPHHADPASAENANQLIPRRPVPYHAPPRFLAWIFQIFHASSAPQPRHVHAPLPQSAPQAHVSTPKVYSVPIKAFQSLDLDSTPPTPEMEVKQALISDDPAERVISLAGGVGTGKTNILCALARDEDVMNAFSDGVWFFDLTCDVNHSSEKRLRSFISKMNQFVLKISPDLLADFPDIPETTRFADKLSPCIVNLMASLMTKKVLLLFDGLSRDNEIAFNFVRQMASAMLFNHNTSLKILASTRILEFAQGQQSIFCVEIHPQDYTAERNRRILCNSAGLPNCDITSLSDPNREALKRIVEKCGGLALALRIAGCGVRGMMDQSVEASEQNAFVQYWKTLEIDSSDLWSETSFDGHEGLLKGIESSLASLQKTWPRKEISVEEMFTSFCVVQKKEEYIPTGVIMKLWNVNEKIALNGMKMFKENGLASFFHDDGFIVGIKISDLMREVSVNMARRRESEIWWHTRIIDGYRASTNRSRSGGGRVEDGANESSNERSRWVNLDKNDKYIIDNIVWHLLGAGYEKEVLRLVTEYKWIEKMNEDERRPAFEKIGSEFEMLREHLERQGKTEADRRVAVEIDAVLKTIGACAKYCLENRKECTFQLYGRLCCAEPACSLVKRIIWSIERDAKCPWARAGPGVLMSEARSELKSVLQLDEDVLCVSAGAVEEEEVIVGGRDGKLRVLNKCDGSVKESLNGHDEKDDIVCVSVDKESGEVYSCTSRGSVIIWNDYRREQEFQVNELEEEKEEWITCMGIMLQMRHVVVGTSEGRLLIMNASGDTIRSVDAHEKSVRSVATGNNVLVSASFDGTIRIWNPHEISDERIILKGHTSLVNSVALNDDETLMASGSYDGTVRLWKVQNMQASVKLVHGQHSSVTSVLFSADNQLLYSGDINGTICVWQVGNDGCDMSLARLLRHAVMSSIESIHMNNDSELLAFSNNQVFVWNTTECREAPHEKNLYLPDVRIFGFSPDEKTISTWSPNSGDRCIKVRNMVDVYRHSDHFVSSFKIADSHDPFQLTVSNDQKMVAYADRATCNVIINHSGVQLYTFSSVHQWAFSSIPETPNNSSQQCTFESLYFSSDGGIATAVAVTKQTKYNSIRNVRKLFRWNLSSGVVIGVLLDHRPTRPGRSLLPLLFCKELTEKSKRKVSSTTIIYKKNDTVFNIATIEHNFDCEQYCFETSRLWVSIDTGGLKYIDLVTRSNYLSSCHEPALPRLSQPHPLPSHLTAKSPVTNLEAEKESPPSQSSPSQSASLAPLSFPQMHVVERSDYVPSILPPILDLSPSSTAPESVVKCALLSDDRSKSSIALVGMGGAGKTTILCALGDDSEVKDKYYDGVWFFELGHDITLSSFIRHLETFVKSTLPKFLEDFIELAASEDTHHLMINQLMQRLATKHYLLLFDDVWDVNASVYNLVCAMSKAVEGNANSLLKLLTSTRSRDIADELRTFTVSINPEELDTDKTLRIFCHHARIGTSDISSLSPHNQDALNSIVETCAGLPLALSVAGSGVRQQMDPSSGVCDESAFGLYWERLKTKPRQFTGAEHGHGHRGLGNALETSLQFLEERWELTKMTEELGDKLGARDMFRSLCIMEKQKILRVCVIERLWGVSDVEAGVMMLSRNSLVSEVRERGQGVVGVRVHDLVLDLSVKMSEGEGGVMKWHGRLVDSFEEWRNGRTRDGEIEEEEWWKLKKSESEKYMREHVVRHLLGARRTYNAVKLLTDYRWIEEMNKDEERPAFRKVITEVEMLRKYLEEEEEKTESVRRIVRDLSVVVRAMELCMTPYCMKNRDECTFQLFGRLRDVVSESGIVERIVCSIERYGERPWARCGPGVLESGRSWLRGVLELENGGKCMCVGTGGEVIVGGREGKIWVLDGGDGSVKKTLVHTRYPVVSVFFDRISRLMFSCDRTGQVAIWKNEEKHRTMQMEREDEEEWISCMQVLPSLEKVVLGTDRGRLLVMDIPSGNVVETVAAHDDQVSSLAIGGSEHVMVSASEDGTIRVWDTERFEDNGAVFEWHTKRVTSVTLSADGRLLASASLDRSVRLWDVQSGRQLWKSPDAHQNSVDCVLFSGDGRLLFSADSMKASVWLVSNDGREVSLVDTHPNLSQYNARCLCLGDGSDLFVLRGDEVEVWDVRQDGNTIESVSPFLPHVYSFGISEDGSTMLTHNRESKLMEIRNVCDVSERVDRVISSVTKPDEHDYWPEPLAVSNDQRFVAYSQYQSCVVYIVDSRNGNVLHSLQDLEGWALSIASAEQDEASNSSSSCDSSSTTEGVLTRGIGTLSFSADGNIITACATADPNPYGSIQSVVHTKSMSWNVQSGEALDEAQLDGDSTAMSNSETPHLVCDREFDGWSFEYSPNVTYRRGASSSVIATVEGDVRGAHYIADSSRLHLVTRKKGMSYIDLITDNTQLPPRNEPPPVPFLSYPLPPPQPNASTDTGADEVYDVFISHAGPDKQFIAELLFEDLVANGLKVFLDKMELHPGQNAPQKMNSAMETARIAVVILSPQFACRPWTMKELLCFLRRFRSGGERGVIIIPVFYRLTLEDCRDALMIEDEDGNKVLMTEEFLQRMARNSEYGIADVVQGLREMRGITGIENLENATNQAGSEAAASRKTFIGRIVEAVMKAMGRIERGEVAGPSRATG